MKKFILFQWIVLIVVFGLSLTQDTEINNLMSQMDETDKCGQMTQVTFDLIEKDGFILNQDPVDLNKLRTAIIEKKVGSILNTPSDIAQKASIWQTIIAHIHDVTANTKLKIPVLYGIDSIHGANYIQESILFPQPLAQAATFNVDLAEKIGEIVAKETRSVGIPWNFSPVMDIGRQPVWPRVWETYGEDIRLAQKISEAYIKGHQGDDLKNRTKAATCLKHYIGYSFPFNGRDRTVAWIPENLLRENFLPTFETGLQAGAQTVMINSADVNGLPGHANYHYLTEILKQELKFQGFTVSDWQDIINLYTRDKIAESPEEAVRIAVMAGVDMSMVPYDYSFFDHCVNLYRKDSAFVKRVNDAVYRILRVKKILGILHYSSDIYPKSEELNLIGTKESDDLNLEAARESIVLAKNLNNILPLNKNANVLVVGPSANLLKVLNGGWSYKWQGSNETYFQTFSGKNYRTIFQAIQNKSSKPLTYYEGSNFLSLTNSNLALNMALNSDFIILCVGEDTYTETPGNIDNMMLSEAQTQLAEQLLNTGKPVILVFVGGRPRTITSIVNRAKAVLIAFLPGNRGGDAIADILYGDYIPNGKMPITYPKGPNGAMTYDYKPLEGYETFNGVDVASYFDAIFPFGHGLSYTSFVYSDLVLNQASIIEPNNVTGRVTVRNSGIYTGKETVIVYLNDEFGSLSRPVKQMKFFKKVTLSPGQSETVNFELTRYDMSFINLKNQRIVESGKFNVYVGNLTASFQLTVKLNCGFSNFIFNSYITWTFSTLLALFFVNTNI